jgi:hypothetical protein
MRCKNDFREVIAMDMGRSVLVFALAVGVTAGIAKAQVGSGLVAEDLQRLHSVAQAEFSLTL